VLTTLLRMKVCCCCDWIPPTPVIDILLGPLELTRRQKVLVWDDEIELPDDLDPTTPVTSGPIMNMSQSISELPPRSPPQRGQRRSLSAGGRAGPKRRNSLSGAIRPVPFASKYDQINPGASGVSVLEHLERLDKVEAGLQRLGVGESVPEEDEPDSEVPTPQRGQITPPQLVDQEQETMDVSLASEAAPAASNDATGPLTGTNALFGAPTSMSERVATPSSPSRWASGLMSNRTSVEEELEKRIVIMEVRRGLICAGIARTDIRCSD